MFKCKSCGNEAEESKACCDHDMEQKCLGCGCVCSACKCTGGCKCGE